MLSSREPFSQSNILTGVVFLSSALVLSIEACSAGSGRQDFRAWRVELRKDAIAFGIRDDVFETALAGVVPDHTLPDLKTTRSKGDRRGGQAEFVRPPQRYLNSKLLARLAAIGRQMWRRHRNVLARIRSSTEATVLMSGGGTAHANTIHINH